MGRLGAEVKYGKVRGVVVESATGSTSLDDVVRVEDLLFLMEGRVGRVFVLLFTRSCCTAVERLAILRKKALQNISERILTVALHVHVQAFLQTTELTLVPSCDVDDAVPVFFASIHQIATDTALEKSSDARTTVSGGFDCEGSETLTCSHRNWRPHSVCLMPDPRTLGTGSPSRVASGRLADVM